MPLKKYSFAFLGLLAVDVVSIFYGWQSGHYVTKGLLMPVLMIALLQAKSKTGERNWRLVLAGLVMAWAGDVLLLFAATRPIFFILGLICFLCTHLAYIFYFARYHPGIMSTIKKQWLLAVAVAGYASIFLAFLWPHLGSLLLPVIVYTIVISLMVLQSVAAAKSINQPVAKTFITGAILFIISDSLLALNKFYEPFVFADVLIMITYGLAQWLIVKTAAKCGDEGNIQR